MIIDTNVNLSRWPFRGLAGDEPSHLVKKLKQQNVAQAWAGSFDGILHKDIASVNARLAEDCRLRGEGILRPFGSINLRLPDWREDLRRCREEHQMLGIRLHPNYHGYDLKDRVFADLLGLAGVHKLIVQVALCMEDERTQSPLLHVPPVDLAPLLDLVKQEPKIPVMILNSYPGLELRQLGKLSAVGEVYFDFSMVEGVGAVARLLEEVTLPRVLFGSNYPLFYFESARLKVQESDLTETQREAILAENARMLSAS